MVLACVQFILIDQVIIYEFVQPSVLGCTWPHFQANLFMYSISAEFLKTAPSPIGSVNGLLFLPEWLCSISKIS